jgi:hypothetical protein
VWFDVATGGTPVGSGNTWQTPFLPSSTSFWAASVEDSDTQVANGGSAARSTTGQYHTNGSFWLLFTANEAFTIRSVKVYAAGAGSRPIGLVNAGTGATITQGNFTIPDGESRVQLDFEVPGPGSYGLRIMSGDPQLWRDGVGSNPAYPFVLGNLATITSSSATGSNATALYYFFYDWEVETPGITCESERVQVDVSMPVGMDDASSQGAVAVYPNPADELLNIEIPTSIATDRMRVQVLDNTGRLVSESSVATDRATLDTQSLANGPYVYRLVNADGRALANGRFVVVH